jgi:hypothetical protein
MAPLPQRAFFSTFSMAYEPHSQRHRSTSHLSDQRSPWTALDPHPPVSIEPKSDDSSTTSYEPKSPTSSDQCSSLIGAETALAVPLEPKWKRYLPCLFSLILATACVSAAIWFAFATERLQPLFSEPKVTLIVISVFQSGSTFLLAQVVGQVLEHLRWTLGSSRAGIGLPTFLGLGSATGSLGVLDLMFWRGATLQYHFWCSQR